MSVLRMVGCLMLVVGGLMASAQAAENKTYPAPKNLGDPAKLGVGINRLAVAQRVGIGAEERQQRAAEQAQEGVDEGQRDERTGHHAPRGARVARGQVALNRHLVGARGADVPEERGQEKHAQREAPLGVKTPARGLPVRRPLGGDPGADPAQLDADQSLA